MSDLELDPIEARVFGVLVEKQMTTPDLYPLTLNSATLGANQKSNRDPVLDLMESDVYGSLQKLIRKGLVGSVHPVGARVEKFRHNGEAMFKVTAPELAVLAELLMRGPQQPGELRARASRMSPIETLPALTEVLRSLVSKGYVLRLEPSPGSRAERYAQTIAPAAHPIDTRARLAAAPSLEARIRGTETPASDPRSAYTAPAARVEPGLSKAEGETLEKRVVELESSVARLRRQLDHLAWKLGEKLET